MNLADKMKYNSSLVRPYIAIVITFVVSYLFITKSLAADKAIPIFTFICGFYFGERASKSKEINYEQAPVTTP